MPVLRVIKLSAELPSGTKMPVQLNLGLKIPRVKLLIDFNDRTNCVYLNQDDLTISQDGSEVSLRLETVEKLCRE